MQTKLHCLNIFHCMPSYWSKVILLFHRYQNILIRKVLSSLHFLLDVHFGSLYNPKPESTALEILYEPLKAKLPLETSRILWRDYFYRRSLWSVLGTLVLLPQLIRWILILPCPHPECSLTPHVFPLDANAGYMQQRWNHTQVLGIAIAVSCSFLNKQALLIATFLVLCLHTSESSYQM